MKRYSHLILNPNYTATWWRHQMETFSALPAICAGNSPVPGEFPTQRPVTRSFGVFFDLRLNKRLSKQSWGWWFETLSRPLWRHCNEIHHHGRTISEFITLRKLILCIFKGALIARFMGVNIGPIWGRQDPGGPHVGPMNFAIWVCKLKCRTIAFVMSLRWSKTALSYGYPTILFNRLNPTGTRRNDVIITSKRRRDVVLA